MRLLNTHTLKVEELFDKAIPDYVILSHTWGAEEVTFQDMLGTAPSHKLGFQKLLNSCRVAKRDGFDYIWIDTCCIDKTSSAELSEAINSMYRWYADAQVCYVYFSDVAETTDPAALDSSFRRSRWFKRGWTLQELLASRARIFLSASWSVIGRAEKEGEPRAYQYFRHYAKAPKIETLLADITGIDIEVLKGHNFYVSIARKMSWAAERQTTRIEDMAYYLMGIFGINMPLLYGEGGKAFQRLQEEILKSSDDESLFAHSAPRGSGSLTILAKSPACFSGWGHIGMCRNVSKTSLDESVPATMTSKGLRLQLPLCYTVGYPGNNIFLALLDCTVGDDALARLAIPLTLLESSRDQFSRATNNWLYVLRPTADNAEHALIAKYYQGKLLENRGTPRFVRIQDVRLETIYVTLKPYYLKTENHLLPYFQVAKDLQSPLGAVILKNVYPRERWDAELGILRHPPVSNSGYSRIVGVLSLRHNETGIALEVILGFCCVQAEQSISSQFQIMPWCQIRVIHLSADISSISSEERLREVFQAAVLETFRIQTSFTTTGTTEIGVAEVKFAETDFLGRQGYVVQVQIS